LGSWKYIRPIINPIPLIPRGSFLEQAEEEHLRGNCMTQVDLEKRPSNEVVSTAY